MHASNRQGQAAALQLTGNVARCSGAWTVRHLGDLPARLARLAWPAGELQLDLAGVTRMDTGGAWLLQRLLLRLDRDGRQVSLQGLSAEAQSLLDLVGHTRAGLQPAPPPYQPGLLEAIGRKSLLSAGQAIGLLAFIGRVASAGTRLVLNPLRIRWGEIVTELGEAGHKALPIVGLLAFLLGIVITYQGGVQLRQYGASIFVADLVGLSMLRELAPILTAIIVAGRTGSAYTAQIGTMQVTEEVDALEVMGVRPMDLLVLPKVLALVIALPLLTVYADIMGVLGGMVMASLQLDIAYSTFMDRLEVALSLESYLVGVGKAPVFAAVIATIGCYQGFQVGGSAESVGRRTTVSVVQSILAVIVIDAAFSVAFSYLGI
jgi:phospholipid/cholesterol/gamma-HCH transport system permease protein